MGVVRRFMMRPEVYRYAAEFGVNEDQVEFSDGPRKIWLCYIQGKQVVGLIDMHVETGSMCIFHPYILREHKSNYDQMVQEFFTWFAEFMPKEAIKLNAYIPIVFKGAIMAAERAKMKREGLDRMSYRTADGVCDRILFGITREELG